MKVASEAAGRGKKVFVIGGFDGVSTEIESALALKRGMAHEVKSDNLKRFQSWSDLVEEAKIDSSLKRLVEAVSDGGALSDINAVRRRIVTSEASADVIFSTVHKAKGMEWPKVELGDDFSDPAVLYAVAKRSGIDPTEFREEWHILYVAATRAISQLRLPDALYKAFVTGKKPPIVEVRRGSAREDAESPATSDEGFDIFGEVPRSVQVFRRPR
ncbi:hypothetical protein N826_25595 [Skermanella aerolata KACC 11604]|nr:hypothetical protein N826_25595 [Skermanella aerolata KACC 11604]